MYENSYTPNPLGSAPTMQYARRIAFSCLWLIVVPFLSFCQKTPAPTAFYQIVERTYGIPEGLPDVCIYRVLLDSKGRLHLATCGNRYASSALQVYDFDGNRAYPSEFKLEHNTDGIALDEQIAADLFNGYYKYLDKRDSLRYVAFQFNAITGVTQCFEMEEHAVVQSVTSFEGELFVCVFESDTRKCKILNFKNGVQNTLFAFDIPTLPERWFQQANLAVTENDFWVAHSAGHIYRINRKTGTQRHYALPGLKDPLQYIAQIFAPPGNGVWINCEGINVWDATTDRFVKNPYLPPDWKEADLTGARIESDLKGNVLVWYLNNQNTSSATLVDTLQQAFDYTSVAWAGSPAINGASRKWMSNDFKQGLVFFLPNLRFLEFSPYNAIQKTLDFKSNRTLVEIAPDTIYSGKHGFLYNNHGIWKSADRLIMDNAWLGDRDIIRDKNGNVWVPHFTERIPEKIYLIRYQHERERRDSFYIKSYLGRYDFLGDHQIAFAAAGNIYLLDTNTGSTKLLGGNTKLSYRNVHQIFVSSDSLIWMASSKGLLRLDPRTATHQWVDLKGKTTVMRIHEDKQKRLWLGTMIRGVLIYDPANGSVKTIDQTNGLSNNLVVNLLEDDDGIIWAGTYNGISLISQEGVVVGKIFESDGLADNECNRYSAMKMRDGRLVFGSNKGISFIDPKLLKKRIQESTPPEIYLTDLSTQMPGDSMIFTDHLLKFKQNQRIVVPANSRNLKISFSLSNYIAPERSNFAYKIEGQNESWNYIGKQRQLSLNALPAGEYNILIKGSDGWGRWSDPPIVIQVKVEEFFYKTWWAFCLYGLAIFSTLYLIRKYQIRQLLEHAENQRLHEIDSFKTKLYTDITHELRTPLTVISGMADLIDEKPDNAKKLIKRNSQGLLRLVNQILDLAKLESGHLQLELIQADIVPHIRYLTESLQSFAGQKNIQLAFETETPELVMDFDERKIETVVTNLLSNAVKFSKEKGEISLRLREADGRLQLQVKDNGIGIPPDKLPHIFERFYQAEGSQDARNTRKQTGSGIGMTLTKELVELMGGEITAKSTLGEGTEFTVSLPISRLAPTVVLEPAAPSEMSLPEIEQGIKPLTQSMKGDTLPLLLLIEDNPDVAAYTVACLEGRYATEWAENGAIGIEKALETIPDAIISDVMMPEKDGFEVCKTLKNDERTSHIPIILLTAKVDVESRLEGLGVGADAYLAKPFLKEELFIRLEKMVELRRKLQERYVGKSDFQGSKSLSTEPTLDDIFLQKIRDLVEANLGDADFGNVQLAGQMFLSESQLFRKLKALTGQSIAIHIRSIRLQKGKELLQSTDLTIADIAYETGFSDPAYFSRTFSQEFGLAPSEVRK